MRLKLKRFLSIVLTVVMMVSVMQVTGISVKAAYENTYLNTGDCRADIISVAKTQLGYIEGDNNDTKYGTWLGYPNQPWCASFVSWCARQAGVPTSILKNSACAGAGTDYFNIPYYDGETYAPESGDLFFTKGWTHVGLVYYTDGDYFYTIEGNSNDNGSSEGIGVYSLRRKISDYYFGAPDYASAKPIETHDIDKKYPTPIKAYTLASGKTIVYDAIDGKPIANKIYDTDLCTINAVYINGWCHVTFPLDKGGTDSGYVKTSVFFDTTEPEDEKKNDDIKDIAMNVSAENVNARVGEEVSVSIKLENNPGVTSMRFMVDYDNRALTMTDFEFGNAFESMHRASSRNYGSPYSMSMYSATDDLEDTGMIAVIKFKVNEDTEDGTYKINISYDKDDIFNMAGNNVAVNVETGSVCVYSYKAGDINSDGNINMRDVVLLNQVINGWDVEYNSETADYNGDGKINMRDIVALQQYINR